MFSYSLTQWILFFFIYCFLGWIWECFYVSFRYVLEKKKWTFINRGFLHGPVIPIYGFAAIVILLTTIQLRENTVAVYIIGALTATVFELVTGSAMEYLFKVKYWDYTDLPLNYHGHICLFVSLFWGIFSILLVEVIHVPIETVILQIPSFVCEGAAFLLVAWFGYDFRMSLNEAINLRDVLVSLTENNETIKRMEHRISAVVAFSSLPDKNDITEWKLAANEHITYSIEKLRWQNEERIRKLKERLMLPEFDRLPERKVLMDKLDECRKMLHEKNGKVYADALKQLRRNPTAKSVRYQEVLELLHSIMEKKK